MGPDCLKGRVVSGTVYEDMHLKYPGINLKGRVLYRCPGFLVLHGLRYRKITILNVFINQLINQSIDTL